MSKHYLAKQGDDKHSSSTLIADRLNKRQREMISLLTIQSAKAVLAHMGDDVEHIKNFYIAAQLYICIAEDDRYGRGGDKKRLFPGPKYRFLFWVAL
jgi:hypothetical protein